VTKVLVISPAAADPASLEIAGPALRYRQLTDELRHNGVEATLASPGPGGDADWTRTRPLELARGQDAVVCPQGLADEAADLARRLPAGCALAVDCYAPALVERALLGPGDLRFAAFRRRVLGALERADLLLVANQPQRAYVAGMLSALGRMAPERTPPPVLLAPMGAPPPQPAAADPATPLVLWYGGLWPWFDGATAIEAFAIVARELPAARLRILGGRHPRGEAPDSLDAVLAAATTLGVRDRVESLPWAAPRSLPDLLMQASCALCLAHDGIEHRLAQRTRLLDLLSAGVPFVCTQGDSLGARAVEAGAATAVPAGDSASAARALAAVLGDSTARNAQAQASQALAADLAPARTLADAVAWLSAPKAGSSVRAQSPWRRRA
jgi:glycosyltransferase involved in cell wall biosynthesis